MEMALDGSHDQKLASCAKMCSIAYELGCDVMRKIRSEGETNVETLLAEILKFSDEEEESEHRVQRGRECLRRQTHR